MDRDAANAQQGATAPDGDAEEVPEQTVQSPFANVSYGDLSEHLGHQCSDTRSARSYEALGGLGSANNSSSDSRPRSTSGRLAKICRDSIRTRNSVIQRPAGGQPVSSPHKGYNASLELPEYNALWDPNIPGVGDLSVGDLSSETGHVQHVHHVRRGSFHRPDDLNGTGGSIASLDAPGSPLSKDPSITLPAQAPGSNADDDLLDARVVHINLDEREHRHGPLAWLLLQFHDMRESLSVTCSTSLFASLWSLCARCRQRLPTRRRGARGPPADVKFVDNRILTSKYNMITFLPINLFQQFQRVANLYFLIVILIQIPPGLSPTPWYTNLIPLAFVLLITAVKDAYDDMKRHKNDHEVNNRAVEVLTHAGPKQTAWQDVHVGDVVRVLNDAEVPADLLLLSSSDPENLCYVETANLDGETNLKLKYAYSASAAMRDTGALARAKWELQCEHPNPRLYTFDGAAVYPNGARDALDANNLLLRGCTLRKTQWVLGLVVFTGRETKIMMNQTPAPRKITQLERHMNLFVLALFVVLISVACGLSVAQQVASSEEGETQWYLQLDGTWPDLDPGVAAFLVQVIRFIILNAQAIPISLYVTLEVVKVLQCTVTLNNDRKMYDRESDSPFRCRTTTLNEELGQVQYVLSDKTGTLTQNVMGFVWMSSGGVLYGKQGQAAARSQRHVTRQHGGDDVPAGTPHTVALDRGLRAQLAAPHVARLLHALAVCNTLVPTVTDDNQLLYQAASPDEEALVTGAAYLGTRLLTRSNERVMLEVGGHTQRLDNLAVLEFSSDRKRMSVIVRMPDGKIKLICKGADSVILKRSRGDQAHMSSVYDHLDEMARTGFRTLCVAERELGEDEYRTWAAGYQAALAALSDREARVAAACDKIECDLELLGATAVEDKLQEGVPQALSDLREAGVKVWMLTGDKFETAVSIAHTCCLFTEHTVELELREETLAGASGQSAADVLEQLHAQALKHLNVVEKGASPDTRAPSVDVLHKTGHAVIHSSSGKYLLHEAPHVGLVVDGGALALCLLPENQGAFMELCKQCEAVVCCRVSPMQKAQVTKLVKSNAGAITLAIGDGANDVGMIQAAHIGCGISGREGRAAVLASDFSFAQFRFLARLLLVHGRWSHKRNYEVVFYSFYKNWMYVIGFVLFSFWTEFSATSIYPALFISTYNAIWTALPIGAYACLEQDVAERTVLAHPQLYQETMRSTRKSFFSTMGQWIALASWHGLVLFWLQRYGFALAVTTWQGNANSSVDIYYLGWCMFFSVVTMANVKVALRTHYFTAFNWGMLAGTYFLLFIPFLGVLSVISDNYEYQRVFARMMSDPDFWLLSAVLVPGACIIIDVASEGLQRLLKPEPFQLLQEEELQAQRQRVRVRRQVDVEMGARTGASTAASAAPSTVDSTSILEGATSAIRRGPRLSFMRLSPEVFRKIRRHVKRQKTGRSTSRGASVSTNATASTQGSGLQPNTDRSAAVPEVVRDDDNMSSDALSSDSDTAGEALRDQAARGPLVPPPVLPPLQHLRATNVRPA